MKQEQESLSTGAPQADKGAQPLKSSRPQKNYYVPYVTPPILYHAIRWFAIFAFHVTSRVRVLGLNNVPKSGAFIIAVNHLSWTDIPLVAMHIKRKVVYMSKEEYFHSKLTWLVRFLGSFPVKRGEGDRQALRVAEEQLKKGNILGIFPEGTRSRTTSLAKAHAGMGLIALRSGVPIVPIAIWGSENALKKLGTRITISYGEPLLLTPKGKKMTREDIDEATDKVMRKIAEMLPPEYRGVYGSPPDTTK